MIKKSALLYNDSTNSIFIAFQMATWKFVDGQLHETHLRNILSGTSMYISTYLSVICVCVDGFSSYDPNIKNSY